MRPRNGGSSLRTVLALLAIAASPALADRYRVELAPSRADDDGALRSAHVEARLQPREGEIGLYRAGADTGLYHQWATFLLEIEAVDERGNPLELVYRPPGAWHLPGWSEGEITVSYTMLLQHDRFPNEPGDDELAAAHPYGVMWTTRALFLEGAPATGIEVEFELPEGWQVTTPWTRTPGAAHRFVARTTDDLLDAAFLAGQHHEVTVPVGGGEARLALGPPVAETEELFAPLLESYLGYYSELLGRSPREAILLIALEASFLGGGVMGRTISLSLDPTLDLASAAPMASYVIAHEGFHLWNGEWSVEKDAGELAWMSEGAADYYAFLAARRLGQIDDATFLGMLADRYSTYLAALDSGKSLVGAAATKLREPDSYDLVYSGGMSAMAAIDLTLRAGGRSADELVRLIDREYRGRALTLAELAHVSEERLGTDLSEFVRRYVRGNDRIPLGDLLDGMGLALRLDESHGSPSAEIEPSTDATPEQQLAMRAWLDGGG